jgi:hypothetical protein
MEICSSDHIRCECHGGKKEKMRSIDEVRGLKRLYRKQSIPNNTIRYNLTSVQATRQYLNKTPGSSAMNRTPIR